MNTLELVAYYANLLILQYRQESKAYATIQTLVTPIIMPQTTVDQLVFSAVPAGGSFVLTYLGNSSTNISWNDPTSNIQTKIQAIPGLGSATVSGDILTEQTLTVTLVGVVPPASPIIVTSNTLSDSGSNPVFITLTEIDLTLPLAVQNGFNLIGSDLAVGVQLDVIGKYVGVSRTGHALNGQTIVLDDTDFMQLIRFKILTNSSGSSLFTIQNLIEDFFGGQVFVFDYQNMHMDYFMNTSIGSQGLAQMVATQGLLPKPMAVALGATIFFPVLTMFYGFRTYLINTTNNTPFNNYVGYHMDWPWLNYAYALS